MKWVLIRHGETEGNQQHRYIGSRTDEPLCETGKEGLRKREYPLVSRVFVSPMKRCLETAQLIYPDISYEIVENFRECDFGTFENLNYTQLNGRADYQAWIDSNGEIPFPGGESRAEFAARCTAAFDALQMLDLPQDCAMIAHGGTIMAIMEKYARPRGSYYDFQIKNGQGYVLSENGEFQLIP